MPGDSLGDRMKTYEKVTNYKLIQRTPVVIRLDGKAFHTLTRGFDKPFDQAFIEAMKHTAKYLMENTMNCKYAYVQSDEISLILCDNATYETQPWFGNKLQKMITIAASMASVAFNEAMEEYKPGSPVGFFDARAFNLAAAEIPNYLIWRQRDMQRNGVQMMARAHLGGQSKLHGKNCEELRSMLKENGTPMESIHPECTMGNLYRKENGTLQKTNADISTLRTQIEQQLKPQEQP